MAKVQTPDLILYCPSCRGGIADYAHHQAEAVAQCGISIRMLCPSDYPHQPIAYEQERCLPEGKNRSGSKVVRMISLVRKMLRGYKILAHKTRESNCRKVLLASYAEYLAPLWAWRFRKLRKSGVHFGAIIHDPVRDFLLGPKLWHRWSVSEGYSFLDEGFVHEPIELDTGLRKYTIRQTVVPHGPYQFPEATCTRKKTRAGLEIPEDANLFLSFGHLRDGKNLRLVLKAMQNISDGWLLVAGTDAGTGHLSSSDYQKLAEDLGVASRCRWVIGFARTEEVADFFNAADFVLLTYERRFRSASGVLNVAARYGRTVVASCGKSNLASAVQKYQLGPWVEPDCEDEIARGMREVVDVDTNPDWEQYRIDNSWETNAQLVIDAMEIKS